MPFHSGYGYGTGDWLWSVFSTALFVVLVTMVVLLLVRLLSGGRRPGPGAVARPVWPVGGPGHGPGAPSAERILAERYARGEISQEEYRSRLEVLRETGFAAGGTGPGGGAYGGPAGGYGGAWAQPVPHARPIPEPQTAPRPQWQSAEPPVGTSASTSVSTSTSTSSTDAPEQPTEEVR